MKNKAILLLVLFVECCFCSFGQEWGQDFQIKDSYTNNDVLPGTIKISECFGTNRKTKFSIPNSDRSVNCYFDESRKITEEEMSEEKFLSLDFKTVYHNTIPYEWDSYGYNDNHDSGILNYISLYGDLEWSVVFPNSTAYWSPNPEPKYQVYYNQSWDSYYDVDFSFPLGNTMISTVKIWEKISNNASAMNAYKRNGYLDLNFRFAFYCYWSYRLNNEHSKTKAGYFHTNKITIRITQCKTESLEVKNNNIPAINGDSINGYAIYEKQTSPIVVSSYIEKSKNTYVDDVLDFVGKRMLKYIEVNGGKELVSGDLDNSIEIGDFYDFRNNEDKLYPGRKYTISRKIREKSTAELSCESQNQLNFTVFPEPYLEGFDASETDTVFCQAKTPLEVGKKLNEQDSTVLYARLKGNRCDFKGFEEYSSTYGVVYGWRYWTNRNSSHNLLAIKSKEDNVVSADEIFDYNLDGDGPDLYFPLSALKPGVTYYFEQYVKLKNFENAVVEATIPEESGLKKFYTVRLSKGLNDEKLKLDVSQNEACYGENLENVVFKAEYEDSENYKDYCLNEKGFKFAWSMDGKEGQSYGVVSEERNYFPVKENHCFSVSLTDGCNNTIEKEACLEVHELPAFSAENIICQSSNVSLTYEIDEVTKDDYVLIKGMKGRQYDITISDEDKSSYNYYYSESEDGANKKKLTTYKEAVSSKILYIF